MRNQLHDGPLTAEEAAHGVQVCVKNASRLRYCATQIAQFDEALGTFVAITRIEELTKATMLHGVAEGHMPASWRKFWQEVRSHGEKEVAFRVATKNPVKGWTAEEQATRLRVGAFDEARIRERALYVDLIDEAWFSPVDSDWSGQTQHCLLLGDQLLLKVWPAQWQADVHAERVRDLQARHDQFGTGGAAVHQQD